MAQEKAHSTEEINAAVRKHLSPEKPVKIGGLDGHHGVLAGLSGDGRVTISGDAGDHLASFLDSPSVTLTGSAGDFAGSTMVAGNLVVEGTVGKGLCCHMAGGSARAKGRVGASAGAMMTGGLLVVDAPVGPGPAEGMTGGTVVLLRPNHLPRRPPPEPARLVVPRGTSKDVVGYGEVELDHDEVADLAAALNGLGVASADKVADLLVYLVPSGGSQPMPKAAPTNSRRGGTSEGVYLEVAKEEGKQEGAKARPASTQDEARPSKDASTRFREFSKEIQEGR